MSSVVVCTQNMQMCCGSRCGPHGSSNMACTAHSCLGNRRVNRPAATEADPSAVAGLIV